MRDRNWKKFGKISEGKWDERYVQVTKQKAQVIEKDGFNTLHIFQCSWKKRPAGTVPLNDLVKTLKVQNPESRQMEALNWDLTQYRQSY